MKNFKKVLALVLVVATLLSFATVASAADFKDEKAISNTEAVEILSAIGVLKGYTDGEFKPTNVITRAEAAKIIAMFDNGDTDIDELYAPVNFTDVENGHWAESYISYCYHTGIIAGVGNNKYAPNDDVTGVQFLKMVLVVLGFDAKEEGLTGTGYAVAARKLALSLGLLNGIGNDFDYTKGLTRENAAQIMLNALTVGTVSYGKVVDYSGDKVAVIADSKAVLDTEDTLAYAWNLYVEDDTDVYGRPSHTWYFFDGNYPKQNVKPSDAIGTYVDAPVASYTTWVAGCDVYDDIGVTSKDPHFVSYTDGVKGNNEVIEDKTSTGTGAQGQLTEIYAIYGENGKINNYVVIHINTYLAKVAKVNAEKKDSKGHVTSARNIELTGYIRSGNNNYKEGAANNTFATTVYTDDFAAGDYVLITGETYWNGNTNARVFNVATIELAETKTAKLTGVDNVSSVAKLSVAGEKTPVACKYAYEADRAVADCGKVMNFYFDSYGNVIGTSVYAAPKSYAVLDKLYIDYVKGEAVVYASLVLPTGETKDDVVVGAITYGDKTMTAWKWIATSDDISGTGYQFQWEGSTWYHTYFYGKMVNYVENDDGTVDLTVPGAFTTVDNAVVKASSKYIWKYTKSGETYTLADAVVKVSDETEFLYELNLAYGEKSSFEHFTGYTNIPSLTYSTIQYVDANGDGVAEFVYVANPVKASSTKYVIALGKEASYEDGIYSYTVMALDAEGKLAETVITSAKALELNGKGLKKVTINNSGLATKVEAVSEEAVAGVAKKVTFGAPTSTDSKLYIVGGTDYDLNDATLYNFGTNADLTLATMNGTAAYVVYSGSTIVAVVVA